MRERPPERGALLEKERPAGGVAVRGRTRYFKTTLAVVSPTRVMQQLSPSDHIMS